jgi:hypothetical protein
MEKENGFDKIGGGCERGDIRVYGVPTDHYPKTLSSVMVCVTPHTDSCGRQSINFCFCSFCLIYFFVLVVGFN